MNSVMRWSYLLAWVFAALAVGARGLETIGVHALSSMPVTSRGLLFFSGFLFLATIATGTYAQASGGMKGRGTAA